MNVYRHHSRVIALVHSHQSKDPIDLSSYLISMSVSKGLKQAGTFQLQLVPAKNWLNVVYANDVIDIYMDPGDGQLGFVRLLFGHIDRVERNISVIDDHGTTDTLFNVTGTDFQKAFEKTEIYFNEYMVNRQDLRIDERFDAAHSGGFALRSAGVIPNGTSAEIIENMINILFGFGAQFTLPESYPARYKTELRDKRKQRTRERIPSDLPAKLAAAGLPNLDSFIEDGTLSSRINALIIAGQNTQRTIPTQERAKLNKIADDIKKWRELEAAAATIAAYRTTLRETVPGVNTNILDVMDFSFMETSCIDGYLASNKITEAQGAIISILNGLSNELVNELFFDLRPVASGANSRFGNKIESVGTISEGTSIKYSNDQDELGINVSGYGYQKPSATAIRYVPAITLRQRPFSVVSGLDLGSYFGLIPFGPVFALGIGDQGRHGYNYLSAGIDALHPVPNRLSDDERSISILDSVSLYSNEISSESIGRSDNEVHNLYELYNSDAAMQIYRDLLREYSPTMTPVSINRNGLRRWQMNTRFGYPTFPGETTTDGINNRVRKTLVRWLLLNDHWYQHNHEYLSGSITTRPRPDIRVGYRLDWIDRHESYYVESISHSWQRTGPEGMVNASTTININRGQRNDPLPVYIPPALAPSVKVGLPQQIGVPLFTMGNRTKTSRLADFFNAADSTATAGQSGTENDLDKPQSNPGRGGRVEYPNVAPFILE